MADTEVISWVTPSGFEIVLTNNTWIDIIGWEGFGMVDLTHIEQETPYQYGAYYKRTKIPARDVTLNGMVWGEGRQGLFDSLSILRSMFNFRQGIGKIRFTTPNGNTLELNCLYKDGLQGASGTDNDGVCWQKISLVFRCFDPFWYGQTTTLSFLIADNPPQWFPLLPITLGGDAVTADFNVFIDGDAPSEPYWTITGPGTNPTLTNVTTNQTLALENVSLGAGEQIFVDTRNRTITNTNGDNLFPRLKWGSGFWDLEPGGNKIRIAMAGADTESKIDLSYQPRYWGVE
jgi:hypothetical protein